MGTEGKEGKVVQNGQGSLEDEASPLSVSSGRVLRPYTLCLFGHFLFMFVFLVYARMTMFAGWTVHCVMHVSRWQYASHVPAIDCNEI